MILSKKLNFLLATFALEQGGKGGRESQGSAAQQTKQILCKGSLFFFGGGFPGIFEVRGREQGKEGRGEG